MDGEIIGKTDNLILISSTRVVYFIVRRTVDISDDICTYAGASPLLSIYDDCDDAQSARSSQ